METSVRPWDSYGGQGSCGWDAEERGIEKPRRVLLKLIFAYLCVGWSACRGPRCSPHAPPRPTAAAAQIHKRHMVTRSGPIPNIGGGPYMQPPHPRHCLLPSLYTTFICPSLPHYINLT
jgi:hypothetical protein